jgi:hypothetical protein
MKHHVVMLSAALLLGLTIVGCEPPKPASSGPPAPPPSPGTMPPVAPAAPVQASAPLPPETKVGVFAGDVNDLAAGPASQPATATASDPNVERVKAQAGVGAKGRSLDQYEGLVVTPVKAFFAGKERAFFDIEFPGNYRTWRVQEDRAPKDFDDLKARFLDPLGLTKHLPPLPPGHKYVWDATNEELQVERPRRQ